MGRGSTNSWKADSHKKYMKTAENIIGTHPFWKGLNPHYFHILRECAAYSKFGLDQCIFEAGSDAEHFYLIHNGHVALETFMPGKGRITLQTIGPGEALGWSGCFRHIVGILARARSISPTRSVSEHELSVITPKRITILAMTWRCASDASSWSVYRRHGRY